MSIQSVLQNRDLSFIFVGGKGGVGKTTTSSALACQLAFDRKVLLISTDPAHSLSDAFRQKFTGQPQSVPGVANLEVMEVNPESFLRSEISSWAEIAEEAGVDGLIEKIHEFQHWLTGIPGVDEATALSSVIGLIESGAYDVIVFDTAPTGHTLKLLQLPEIMQIGLNKLESWQSTVWNYWEVIKGAGASNPTALKRKVAQRIRNYKHGIERVGAMLKDSKRTAFVVVCIAEYLSISESRRLLEELHKHKVNATHIVVNQLVKDTVGIEYADKLKSLLSSDTVLLDQVLATISLCEARNSIQQKYLAELKSFPEVAALEVIEVPLLPKEITGPEALLSLSTHLLPKGFQRATDRPALLIDRKAEAHELYEDFDDEISEGDRVVIVGLHKSPHYNGVKAEVVKVTDDGRVAVRLPEVDGKHKILSLKMDNVQLEKGFL